MFQLIYISALTTLALGASPRIHPFVPILDGKIVGGQNANIEDYPYQVSLETYGKHFCGASILSETKVLTAAHCTNGWTPRQLNIRVGSSFREQGGQVIRVIDICQHPDYNRWIVDNDVSVLTLETPIEFGAGAQSVALQDAGEDVPLGTLATVSGWGTLYSDGPTSNKLQKVDVPRVSDVECKKAYNGYSITDSMFCFGVMKGERDSCQGDSGGPLVTGGVQIGIVSWGIGCAVPYYPGIYAKVAHLRDHIDNC